MVHFVGAGPGAPDLITVRGKSLLERADSIIYAGSLVNKELLNYAPKNCSVYNSASMTLDDVINVISENERKGLNTVRLHTGDPSVYGAVREQFDRLKELNIDFDVTPGVSSMFAAASALKTEFTLPDVTQTVIITRMEGRTPVPESESLEELSKHNSAMVIFLSVHMIENLVSKLLTNYEKNTPAAVVYRASWNDEKIIKGTLEDIAEKTKKNGVNKTALVFVGDFMSDVYSLSKLYDKHFTHEYRKGVCD